MRERAQMVAVTFADLTHVGSVVDANLTPLAIGYVSAYAKHQLKNAIDIRLFKYPAKFEQYLNETTPAMACFSNYMWNERLQLEFAHRIKLNHPNVITVFGGPNYPTDISKQHGFLQQHTDIDFYVDGEGEQAFVELFRALEAVNFDANRLKSSLIRIPNTHYLVGDKFIRGDLLPRIRDIDATLPSPYLSGMLDEFFDDSLTPLIQTSRGCPYSCTFCHDGILYMNKTPRFTQDRINQEIDYISKRAKVSGLNLADLNWGLFPEDIETAKHFAALQQEKGWPVFIATATAKNQKDRIVEMSEILNGTIQIGASVQSTDTAVLSNIKRANIGFDAIVKMAKGSALTDTSTFSEIILCLPGDTREKHFQSVYHMMDAGIQEMRTYQFIMLPGTEASDDRSREKFEYQTTFRVLPRCFGRYQMYGEDVSIAEIHEVCVGNSTMPHEAYLACRDFDLSLAIFNNGNISDEVMGFAEALDIPRSVLFRRIHETAVAPGGTLESVYKSFRADEERNFWNTLDELEGFLSEEKGFEAYVSGEHGANQIYKYRSVALFEYLEDMTDISLNALREELKDRNILDTTLEQYLEELRGVIIARKTQITDVKRSATLPVHFDFVSIHEKRYALDPRDSFVPDGQQVSVLHSEYQQQYLSNYFNQYGPTLNGLSFFIQRQPAHMLYRQIENTRQAN
jgi:radical SAM superfamily enzyme YgiQ (UPF0313 family)